MSKWRKFCKLGRPGQRTFLLALVLLPLLAVALRLVGLRRTQGVLMALLSFSRNASECVGRSSARRAVAIGTLVEAAASHGVHRANCLQRSLALWWLLKLNGIEAELRIGVRKVAADFEAHAWVEYRGRPLNDRDDVPTRFTPFHRAIATVG